MGYQHVKSNPSPYTSFKLKKTACFLAQTIFSLSLITYSYAIAWIGVEVKVRISAGTLATLTVVFFCSSPQFLQANSGTVPVSSQNYSPIILHIYWHRRKTATVYCKNHNFVAFNMQVHRLTTTVYETKKVTYVRLSFQVPSLLSTIRPLPQPALILRTRSKPFSTLMLAPPYSFSNRLFQYGFPTKILLITVSLCALHVYVSLILSSFNRDSTTERIE